MSWFGRRQGPRKGGGEVFELEREAQNLRLDLKEKICQVEDLKAEIERLRTGEETRVVEAVKVELEGLISEAAGAVAQLLTQEYLLSSGKAVQTRDVLSVALRLAHLFMDKGLEVEGRAGETVAYDLHLHEPLGAETIGPGERVVVKLPGIRYKGKVMRKAVVAVAPKEGGEGVRSGEHTGSPLHPGP